MFEARQDIITGQWVIFSSVRTKRPSDFVKKSEYTEKEMLCPFCSGHEHMTPRETFRCPSGTLNGWEVRIVENKYPAVSQQTAYKIEHGFYASMQGYGVHEVVVDTPHHNETFVNFSPRHMRELLYAMQARTAQIEKLDNIRYVQIFKNCGEAAGASLKHSHWQLLGVPFLPQRQLALYAASTNYRDKNGGCVFCDMVKEETAQQVRIIFENDKFISFAPYASRYSYEIWIMAKQHAPSLQCFADSDLNFLSDVLLHCIRRLNQLIPNLCYNICFSEKPKDLPGSHFHWHLQIIPRMGNLAGFELGTHSYINPILPETAVANMKGVSLCTEK